MRKTMDTDERRAFERVNLHASVTWSSETNFYKDFTSDISTGGLFVATFKLIPVGTVIDLEFSMPGEDEPVKIKGVVRWIKDCSSGEHEQPGMGIEFLNISEEDKVRIERFSQIRDFILSGE